MATTGSSGRNLTAGHLRAFDLVSLRLLLAAIEEGNLARVARREGISLSAVSRRISALESRIGVKLLQRHDRGVTPTASATDNLSRLRNLFGLIDQIVEEFADIRAGARGVVRVRAHLTAIIGTLPEQIAAFHKQHPLIRVIVDEAKSTEIVHALQIGECDLGFVSGTVETGALTTFPWRTDNLRVIMPAGHPLESQKTVRFAALLAYPFIGMAAGTSLLALFRGQAAALGRTLDEVARVSTFEGVREMVTAGVGIGIVPAGATAGTERAHGLSWRPLDESWARRSLLIGVKDPLQIPAAAQRFLAHLRKAG